MNTVRVLLLDGADMFPFMFVERELSDPKIKLKPRKFQREELDGSKMKDATSKAAADIIIISHRGARGAEIAKLMPDDFHPERVLLVAGHADIDTSAYPERLNLKPWAYNSGAARRLVFMIGRLPKLPKRAVA